jgi:transcriptional regulator with XRE-family HTH domain
MEKSRDLLGKNLKRLREARGLTQPELAEAANLSVKMVQKIEYGNTNPSTKTLDCLSTGLKCHPSELLAPIEDVFANHINDCNDQKTQSLKHGIEENAQDSGGPGDPSNTG